MRCERSSSGFYRTGKRPISRHPAPLYMELPSVPEEDLSLCVPALAPGNSRPVHSLVESRQEKLGLSSPAGVPPSNTPFTDAASVIRAAEGRSKMQKMQSENCHSISCSNTFFCSSFPNRSCWNTSSPNPATSSGYEQACNQGNGPRGGFPSPG